MSDQADKAPAPLSLGDVHDLGDAVTQTGVSQHTTAALELAAGFALIMATVASGGTVGVVAIGIAVLGALGIFSKTDGLAEAVAQIKADFSILFDEFQAEADLALMRSVGDKIDDARTTLQTLRGPDFPDLRNPNGAVLFNSSRDVESLGDIDFYKRPFFPAAAYSDPWSGRIAPAPFPNLTGASIVFDYRLTLPAYLEAITIRLAILTALVPDFRTSHQVELRRVASRLETFYTMIRDGIIPIRNPTPFGAPTEILATKVFNSNDGKTLIRIEPSAWEKAGRLYGAVETYSAVAVVDHYRSDRFLPDPQDAFLVRGESPFGERENPNPPPLPNPQFPSQEGLFPFLLVHAIGTLARSKAVYRVVGLQHLKAMVDFIKDLAGEPRLGPDPESSWSLREIHDLLGHIFEDPDESQQLVHARARDTITRLARLGDLVFAKGKRLSWREALDAVAL